MTKLFLHPRSHMARVAKIADNFLHATGVFQKPTRLGERLAEALTDEDRAELPLLINESVWNRQIGRYDVAGKQLVQIAEKFAVAADRLNLLGEASKHVEPWGTNASTAEALKQLAMPSFAKLVMIARW